MESSAVAVVALESGAGADPGAAAQKRPMNAFLIFCKRHRSVVKSKYPHLENRSITKILGEWWAALDADQKQTYTELARQYKEAFMKANPNFKWYKTDTFPNQPPPPPPPHQQPQRVCCSPSPTRSASSSPRPLPVPIRRADDHSSVTKPATLLSLMAMHRAPQSMQSPPRSDSPPTTATGGSGSAAAAASSASSSSSAAAPPLLSSRGSSDQQSLSSGQKENIAIMATAAAASSSPVMANSTPKPPKKRYLENSEFRALNAPPVASSAPAPAAAVTVNHSTNHHPVTTSSKDKSSSFPAAHPNSSSSNQSNNQNHHSSSSHPLPVPVLDVETMNRVIVDALSSNGPNPSPSTYTNGMFDTKSSRSEGSSETAGRGRSSPPDQSSDGGHVTANGGAGAITSESVASLTAASLLNAESQLPIGSATKAIASAKSAAAASTAAAAVSGIVSVTTSISAPPPTPPEDKPLNLSSSKVLHASNQQIIDHFIDKLLSSGGECGEGNPMPAEMLASNCVNSSNSSSTAMSSSSGGGSGSGGKGSGSRKDRSCKGKRYLEMISESKGSGNGSKRPKSNSMSSGTPHGDTAESSPSKSSSGNSSKWVSGGFDLEERIAALPQLQDTHLVNALNNNRTRNTVNGKSLLPNGTADEGSRKNGSDDAGGDESPHSPHHPHPDHNSAPSSPSHPLLNGDAKSAKHYVNNNDGGNEKTATDRRSGEDKVASSPASSISTVCSGDEGDGNSRSSPVLKQSPSSSSPSSPPFVTKMRAAMPPDGSAVAAAAATGDSVRPCGGNASPPVVTSRQFLSSNFSLSRSQGLEVGPCDGLAALAEVALSQAQAITTSSSS